MNRVTWSSSATSDRSGPGGSSNAMRSRTMPATRRVAASMVRARPHILGHPASRSRWGWGWMIISGLLISRAMLEASSLTPRGALPHECLRPGGFQLRRVSERGGRLQGEADPVRRALEEEHLLVVEDLAGLAAEREYRGCVPAPGREQTSPRIGPPERRSWPRAGDRAASAASSTGAPAGRGDVADQAGPTGGTRFEVCSSPTAHARREAGAAFAQTRRRLAISWPVTWVSAGRDWSSTSSRSSER